jgi:hypothetical protein
MDFHGGGVCLVPCVEDFDHGLPIQEPQAVERYDFLQIFEADGISMWDVRRIEIFRTSFRQFSRERYTHTGL